MLISTGDNRTHNDTPEAKSRKGALCSDECGAQSISAEKRTLSFQKTARELARHAARDAGSLSSTMPLPKGMSVSLEHMPLNMSDLVALIKEVTRQQAE